jgi:alpha-L-fucosidase 2
MSPGGVGVDSAHLNHSTFWSGSPRNRNKREQPVGEHGPAILDQARTLIAAGRIAEAEQLMQHTQADYAESFLPLGQVEWTLWVNGRVPTSASVEDYRRELNLATGELTWSYIFDGVQVSHRGWTDRVDNAFRVEIEATADAHLEVATKVASPWRSRLRRGEITTTHPSVALSVEAPETVPPPHEESSQSYRYGDGASAGMAAAFAVQLRGDEPGTWVSGILSVAGKGHIGIVITAETGYQGALVEPNRDGNELAIQSLNRAAQIIGGDVHAQLARHHEEHRRLFDTFALELGESNFEPVISTPDWIDRADGDPRLIALATQFGRYLLISSSSSSPGALPANLQGIWNNDPRPLWSSGYTININLQMNYWQAGPANLASTTEPLWSWLSDLATHGQTIAQASYGVPGWLAHHNSDAWGYAAQVGSGELSLKASYWPYGGAWLALMLWDHFTFTADTEWLATVAWPVLDGAAQATLALLVEQPDGTLGTSPSTSPENEYLDNSGARRSLSFNGASDLEVTRLLFDAVCMAAGVLGHPSSSTTAFSTARDRLSALQVDGKGRLLEWGVELTEHEPDHRHLSHLIGLYPGSRSLDGDPELAAAAAASLDDRGDQSTTWALVWRAALRARLRDGERAADMLARYLVRVPETQVDTLTAGVYGNLLCSCPPFQIDASLGFPAVVCEMLLQSHADEIHLLPALPDRWATGTVRGIRARPGVTTSLSWREGKLVTAVLVADRDVNVIVRIGQTRLAVALIGGERTTLTMSDFPCPNTVVRDAQLDAAAAALERRPPGTLATIRAVLFDLDGVLTPTAEVHRHAWSDLFTPYLRSREDQTPYSDADYFRYIDGIPRYEGVANLLAARGIDLPMGSPDDSPETDTVCGLGNRKNALFTQALAEHGVLPYPGSLAFLDASVEAGLAVAVVTSSRNSASVLAAAGLSDRFTIVVDGLLAAQQSIAGKPAPDTYLRAAELIGIPPADCAVIEDAHSGVAAGRAGRFGLVVGVDRGVGADTLLAHGADCVVDDLAELIPHLPQTTIKLAQDTA